MSKRIIPIIIVLMLLLSGYTKQSNAQDALSDAKGYLQSEMDNLRDMLVEIGKDVGHSPANDEKAYKLLNNKLNSKKYFYDIVVCDKNTNILNVSTKMDFAWIGLNLGHTDRFAELFVSDPVFLIKPEKVASDNTPFIYCAVPIENGGWVIAYIDPYSFTAEFSSLAIGQNIDLGVIDTKGTNIYTSNMTEIGKNVLTDDLSSGFEELRKLIKDKMIPNKQGNGKYTYCTSGVDSPVEKYIQWNTIQAFGSELRIYTSTEQGVEKFGSAEGELREFTKKELSYLDSAKLIVENEFSKLSALTESAISTYQKYGGDSKELVQSLANISKGSAITRNIFLVNPENMIIKAYPEYFAGNSFQKMYGINISSDFESKKPFIFDLAIEDYKSPSLRILCFAFPVLKEGKTAGWIISQVRLYDLAAYLTKLKSLGENVNFMLVNKDGTVLYDGDIVEVGRICYEDDLYSDSMGDFIKNEFMKESEGESEYEFSGVGMTEIIPKRIVWKTFSFMGNDFKISMNSEWSMGF
jgi:hypothetical protein